MGLLAWTPELDTGIDEIDRQHRRLVDYINQLYALLDTDDRPRLGRVIDEMLDYTLSHFAFEETMLESAGYVFLGPHRKVHEIFTRRVAELHARFIAGENVTAELHGLLSRWLLNHIRNEDRAYVEVAQAYLRAAGSAPKADAAEPVVRGLKKGWLARLFAR